ncbi:MAG TPA: 6-phosphofructokinase [Actinomycetales bacterium]|jgi:6-phosphofructokinase 1
MRIGVLTGGGDCPGLNAVIRAVVLKGVHEYGHEFIGFRRGWKGPIEGLTMPLGLEQVDDVLSRGGTILGSSRTNPYSTEGGVDAIRKTLAEHGVDALVAIGGEDTLGVAKRLTDDGIGVVGVPKTIDNDLGATDYTFGFDTAVAIATEAIDRVRTTAESHERTIVVEVMGRHAGWIALHSGMAGGADVTLVPEFPFDVDQVCEWVNSRYAAGHSAVLCVAEGALPQGGSEALIAGDKDEFGHVRLGGIATWLAGEIEQRTGHETRATILGHIQRGGTPTAYDRVLSTRFGLGAIEAVNDGDFGVMIALRGTDIVRVKLSDATAVLKTVPAERYAEAQQLFG